jgi:hypothetical protein
MMHPSPPLLTSRLLRKSLLTSALCAFVLNAALANPAALIAPRTGAEMLAGGAITGQGVDAKGEGISGVTVIVEGYTLGASTDLASTHSVANVPASK